MMLHSALLSVLVLGAAGGRLGASTSAEGRAKVWLREHQSPDAQGLDDLKNSDPNSYAIVQALLMKQQAGLMDASNPGGFTHHEHESAADIMRSAPSIEGASSSMSELSVSAPVTTASFTHGNPWAFKAKPSDDDAMSIITGGSAPASVDDAPQPISEVAVSAPVQRRSFSASASEEEKEERAALNKDNNVLSILSGGDVPTTPRSASPRMSEVAIAAPVRHAEYTPPVQQAEYSRSNPLAYNAKKADDDIMSMIGGDPSPSNSGEVSQPISEVAISAPVQHAEYTPPVQEYTPPVQEYTPPVQTMQYTPPVQQAAYSPSNSLLSSNSQVSQTVAAYTPPVQTMQYTPPMQQVAYTPPVQTMQYTPPVQQAEYSPSSSLLSSKRSTVSDAVSSAAPIPGDNGGLAEFQASDPNGFAIVQSLLKQQQAGLLDPSNPANFKHEDHESAADIMRSAPAIEGVASQPMSELAVSAPVYHASYTPHGNPWGFQAKKADDDALSIITGGHPEEVSEAAIPAPVKKVALSASNEQLLSILSDSSTPVHHASYTQYTPHAQYSHGNPLSFNSRKADDDVMSIIGGDSSPSQPMGEVAQPAASMIKQSSYLSQINFPMKQRQEQPVQVPQAAGADLKSFSWDEYGDVASGRVQVRPVQTQYIQQQEEETVSDNQLSKMDQKYEEAKVKGGSLSSWLAPIHEAPAARNPQVEQNQEDETASYDKHDPNNAMAMDNYISWAHTRAFQ